MGQVSEVSVDEANRLLTQSSRSILAKLILQNISLLPSISSMAFIAKQNRIEQNEFLILTLFNVQLGKIKEGRRNIAQSDKY